MRQSPSRICTRFPVLALCLLLIGCSSDRPIYYHIQTDYSVNDPQFAQTMSGLLGPALEGGNEIETLLNGDEIFPSMLHAIRDAKKTITLETYIYWSGKIGQEFADALSERARAGVKVHVLLDAVGSSKMDKEMIEQMRDAGAHVYRYHAFHLLDPASWAQLDHRTHRKILVMDGKVGFTGGVGIADEWRGHADRTDTWRDTHYRITGPVVGELQGVFVDNWMQTTGAVLAGDDYFPRIAPTGQNFAQICKSSSLGGSENMQLMVLLSIAAAAKNVRIESAYFVPDKLTRDALIAATKRGAKVQIIVPGSKIDEKIVRRASRARWGDLLKAGVEIYEYQPTMFHCKQLIIDDRWVSIGSSNMDNRSFRINDEANLNVLNGSFAAQQIKVFEDDKKKSRKITYEHWKSRPLIEKIGNQLASLLGWEI